MAGEHESVSAIRLDGQTAIVTGGSSGIGAAIARVLGRAGAAVGVNYHASPEGADAVVSDIRTGGGRAVALQADVSREADVQAMLKQFVDAFGRLDIMVANAGIQKDAAFVDMSPDEWRKVLNVNLTGQFLCVRDAVRQFCRQPRVSASRAAGKVICMSSVHEVIPWAGHVNYAASKGGVALMVRSVAQEIAHEGVRINGIAPGAIRTDINRDAWETPEAERELLKLIPYGRVGDPDDIAKAALWLGSDESDYVTGTTLFVDGGMTLYPAFREGG